MRSLILACAMATGACVPDLDLDLDLDLGFGNLTGEQSVVTWSYVDGCPGGDPLFGCRDKLAPLAVGAQARFIMGSTTGEADDERQVASASVTSGNPSVVAARRDADGVIYLDARRPGDTTIDIVAGGDVIDSFFVRVEAIAMLVKPLAASPDPRLVLVGSQVAMGVTTQSASGETLYAHGAIRVVPGRSIELVSDVVPFFTASDAVGLQIVQEGMTQLTWVAESDEYVDRYRAVARDEIESVSITELFPTADANKMTLEAEATFDERRIDGGPVCDWAIVSGDATMSAFSETPFTDALIPLRTGVQVYGLGDVTIACRANDRVVATHTIHLGR